VDDSASGAARLSRAAYWALISVVIAICGVVAAFAWVVTVVGLAWIEGK
jgi:hypothetical protein